MSWGSGVPPGTIPYARGICQECGARMNVEYDDWPEPGVREAWCPECDPEEDDEDEDQ